MSTVLHHNEADAIDTRLSAHGLRRTAAARRVLGWLLAHPDTSYTHAQLQAALAGEGDAGDSARLVKRAGERAGLRGTTPSRAQWGAQP